jgi:microcystin-dependent protein
VPWILGGASGQKPARILVEPSYSHALFSLLGTAFGGDGKTNFALPNLGGRVPGLGTTFIIALQGIFPPRN